MLYELKVRLPHTPDVVTYAYIEAASRAAARTKFAAWYTETHGPSMTIDPARIHANIPYRSKVHLTLTPTERATLTGWLRKPTLPAVQVRRARLVLLVADGRLTIHAIAVKIGLSRRHVYKWLARFQTDGVAGLYDHPKGHRPTKEHAHA